MGGPRENRFFYTNKFIWEARNAHKLSRGSDSACEFTGEACHSHIPCLATRSAMQDAKRMRMQRIAIYTAAPSARGHTIVPIEAGDYADQQKHTIHVLMIMIIP